MRTLLLSIFSVVFGGAFAQNIGINTDGSAPNNQALLHVSVDALAGDNKRGFLGPSMTTAERDASFPAPVEGLEIYNKDTHCKEFYNGTVWVPNCGSEASTDCPSGMMDFGTFCVDTAFYSPDEWIVAVDTCNNRGLRLCLPPEMYIACENGIPNTGYWEWTSDFMNNNMVMVVGSPPCWSNWSQGIDATYRYRCCYTKK